MANRKKEDRDLGRSAKTTRVSPFDLLIAGEDFGPHTGETCDDFAELRDAESKEREAIDENYIEIILAHGPQNPVRVTMRRIEGRDNDNRYPVVVHGRRTLRHVREIWRRHTAGTEGYDASPPMVEVRVIPSSIGGAALFQIARLENHPGLPETPAQLVEYVGRCVVHGQSDGDICKLLQIRPTQLPALKKLAEVGMIRIVRDMLDSGAMAVTAAGVLADKTPEQQQAAIQKIESEGGKFTVDAVRRALAGEGVIQAKFSPPRKTIAKLLADADMRKQFDAIGMKPSDVLLWTRGELAGDKLPTKLKRLLDEVG